MPACTSSAPASAPRPRTGWRAASSSPPHRDGGQAQYIDRPVPQPNSASPISRALEWASERLEEPLGVEDLARAAHMSLRSFIRAFKSSTGTTPASWLRERRLEEVKRLLEMTDLSIDTVAARCGFASPVTMRQSFARAFATTPSEYRRRFALHRADRSRAQLANKASVAGSDGD